MEKNNDTKYVPWMTFVWAIGIFIVVIGWLLFAFSSLASEVRKYNEDVSNINIQLSQIQTDIAWIKNNLK